MILDAASEGNFKTRTLEEARRLIENLMSSKSSKNMDMHMIKSAAMDSDKMFEGAIGSVHEVLLVEHVVEKDEDQSYIEKMESMIEKVLKIQ